MNNNGHADKSAWIESILAEYEAPLTRYAAHLTGDAERARDVVQDTFVRLWREDEGRLKGRVAEWLFTVCRNRALDVQRKEGRVRGFDAGELENVESGEASPSTRLEREEAASCVLRVISTLPARQQELIRLKFQHGLSYQEISRITNLSVSNVGFLIHKAMKRLRQQLRTEAEHR